MYMNTPPGIEVEVDDCDFDHCSGFELHEDRRGPGYLYFACALHKNKYLHQLIVERMGLVVPDGCEIDHKDGNICNNKRNNLRVATVSQNQMNKRIQSNNKSGCPGVNWHSPSQKWQAHIKVDRKWIPLGYYYDKNLAIKVYMQACIEHFGEFARIHPTLPKRVESK